MSDQNWRTDVDAGDYFLHQKKQLQLADRRPVIRKGSDLVGPGIGASAVRLTDYNSLLAAFNGYYASAPGVLHAPNDDEAFTGYVISDAALGGQQVFTGLTSGTEYRRTFIRSAEDPESIWWGEWAGARVLASAQGLSVVPTGVTPGGAVLLAPPQLSTIGAAGVYERSEVGIRVRQQGIYTGTIQIGAPVGLSSASIFVRHPHGASTAQVEHALLGTTTSLPFTCWAADAEQGFSVFVTHNAGSRQDMWWRFSCTRVGDAV